MGLEGDDRGYALYLAIAAAMVLVGFIARGDVGWRNAAAMGLAWVGIFAVLFLLASMFPAGRAMG